MVVEEVRRPEEAERSEKKLHEWYGKDIFLQAVRPASHKATTPGGTTKSSRVWQQLLRAGGIPSKP